MDTNQVFALLVEVSGIDASLFHRHGIEAKLAKVATGSPALFTIRGTAAGRCYYEYEEVVFNYTGADSEKPMGMTGKVSPYEIGETKGVKWAKFFYGIDSGD